MELLTLDEAKHPNIIIGRICPMCGSNFQNGQRIMWAGKGTGAVCLSCVFAMTAALPDPLEYTR